MKHSASRHLPRYNNAGIQGVKVIDDKGDELMAIGIILEQADSPVLVEKNGERTRPEGTGKILSSLSEQIFPVSYVDEHGQEHMLGEWVVYSSQRLILKRVEYGFYLILVNSVIKTIALWFIFLVVIRRLLGRPLEQLKTDIEQVNLERIESSHFRFRSTRNDEFKVLQNSFSMMVDGLKASRQEVDRINQSLEQKVLERTRQLQQEKDRAQKYLDTAGVMLCALNPQGEIILINHMGCLLLEVSEEEALGANWFDNFLPARLVEELSALFKELIIGPGGSVEYYENLVLTAKGNERLVAYRHTLLTDDAGHVEGLLFSGEDITERKLGEQEREQLISDLTQALAEIKTLRGIIPICSFCKKIRDDKGFYEQIESFVSKHTDAEFSHGICPDCAKKHYPDIFDEEND